VGASTSLGEGLNDTSDKWVSRPLHRSVDADELRPVTALFADVVGSTSLGEQLAPAEVKAVIGECVTRMCEVVEAFGGEVTGQMGDGIASR